MKLQSQLAKDNSKEFSKSMSYLSILFNSVDISPNLLLACRSRQASIVLERYFRFEVSLLYFYACERDGPIWVSGGSDIIT